MKNYYLATMIAIAMAVTSVPIRAQKLAVGTDVAMDLLMMPSLGLEIVTGERSTVGLNVMTAAGNPYWATKLSGVAVQPEYRYYFSGRPMHKFFVGGAGLGALYDITVKDKVYDGYAFGLGLTYGYVWNINHRLNIDFHSGIGFTYYRRKEYFINDNFDIDYTIDGMEQANAKGYYLLPTRIGVSVTYILW